MTTSSVDQLKLYAQTALLGEVAPSFRAVSFYISESGLDFKARFVFDGKPTEEAKEVASTVLTNILANYSSNHRTYSEELLSVPYPNNMNHLPLLVYLRNEDEWNSWTKGYGEGCT